MGNIKNVEEINASQNTVPEIPPEEVMVDTKGELVQINGKQFLGHCKVPKAYAQTIESIVQARKRQSQKNKQFKEHIDKFVGNVSGKAYR